VHHTLSDCVKLEHCRENFRGDTCTCLRIINSTIFLSHYQMGSAGQEPKDVDAMFTTTEHKTFQFDSDLPSLPVPPLQHTLERYLDSGKVDHLNWSLVSNSHTFVMVGLPCTCTNCTCVHIAFFPTFFNLYSVLVSVLNPNSS